MLQFQNVSYAIGTNQILQNINFKVNPGELVAILGASGAGKSSVFRLLISEIKPTLGHIKLDNFSLEDLSFDGIQDYRRQVGIVFQDFRLLPQKTVFENVAFALEACGEEHKIKTKVPELLELVGLKDKAQSFPRMLSGGEKQRVAIARALVHDPKILIADEATGNLDPKNSREIADVFRRLNQFHNMTIFFATHDPVLVERLAPRIIRLESGEIIIDQYPCSMEDAFDGIL